MSKTVKNTNGYYYMILTEISPYTLLIDVTEGNTGQFVVAYKLQYSENGCFWQRGSYFSDLFTAVECLQNITRQRGEQFD